MNTELQRYALDSDGRIVHLVKRADGDWVLWDDVRDELRRLRELVAKLPRTADGVPVVPGMTVYDAEGEPVSIGGGWFDVVCGDGLESGMIRAAGHYSTAEAARDAGNKPAADAPQKG